ncbi:hypothetical protein [Janthinobacterium sp.]|uniref:hypothetical protein n=1 Tax=Janthinobacterium sp. TaxID=1871054 RepID=UPI002602AFD5|nr:hypothetical protein [Janthinobacterium sp.]
MRALLPLLFGLLLHSTIALAQTAPTQQVPQVKVDATRDPVDKSYRKMMLGVERFERDHALAPQASLRFRLLPRQPGVDMRGVQLRIAGDTVSVPLPLAADNSFAPVRNEQALREDAVLLANRKASTMSWRAQVITPGLPPDTRRLGDLRLECRAGMDSGLISNDPQIIAWLSSMLYSTDKVCNQPDGNYLFFADRPLFGVTLVHGGRRVALPFKMLYAGGEQTPASLPYCDCQVLLDHSYYAPLWDASWPDDSLLELRYMDEVAP